MMYREKVIHFIIIIDTCLMFDDFQTEVMGGVIAMGE